MGKKHERKDEKAAESKPGIQKLSLKVLSNVRGGTAVRAGLLAACCTKTHHCVSSVLPTYKVDPAP